MLAKAPLGLVPVQLADQRRLLGQVPDQHQQPPRGEPAPVPVEQVDPVEPEQVRLDRLGVLGQEPVEADPSPNDMPVSLP
ncbi:hypothetical protein GCM10010174_27210 [Kutzneria viridogrisea]